MSSVASDLEALLKRRQTNRVISKGGEHDVSNAFAYVEKMNAAECTLTGEAQKLVIGAWR